MSIDPLMLSMIAQALAGATISVMGATALDIAKKNGSVILQGFLEKNKTAISDLEIAYLGAIQAFSPNCPTQLSTDWLRIVFSNLAAANNEKLREQIARLVITPPAVWDSNSIADIAHGLRWPQNCVSELKGFLELLRMYLTQTKFKLYIDYLDKQKFGENLQKISDNIENIVNAHDQLVQESLQAYLDFIIPQTASKSTKLANFLPPQVEQVRPIPGQDKVKDRNKLVSREEDEYREIPERKQGADRTHAKSTDDVYKNNSSENNNLIELLKKDRIENELNQKDDNQENNIVETQKLLILGNPGSGKTTGLNYVAHEYASAARTSIDTAGGLSASDKVPLLFSLSEFAQYMHNNHQGTLLAFIKYSISNINDIDKLINKLVNTGQAIILLDGLDLVLDDCEDLSINNPRYKQILSMIKDFADKYCTDTNRNILVIARRTLTRKIEEQLDFPMVEICALEYASINQCINAPELEREMVEKLKGILAYPLFLNIFAKTRRENSGTLIHALLKFYKEIHFEESKNRRLSHLAGLQPIYPGLEKLKIAKFLGLVGKKQLEKKGTLTKREITFIMRQIAKDNSALIELFLRYLHISLGVITINDLNNYALFPPGMEDYYAARHISKLKDNEQLEFIKNHPRSDWQNIYLLVAEILREEGNIAAQANFLACFFLIPSDTNGKHEENINLAGKCQAVIGITPDNMFPRILLQHALRCVAEDADLISQEIHSFASDHISPVLRASAADLLDEFRFEPKNLAAFIKIGARKNVFYIGKYPVTNEQYARFLTADDFNNEEFWRDAPAYNAQDINILLAQKSMRFEEPLFWKELKFGNNRRTAPVVGISWWEANAYCKWVHKHWECLEEGQVSLVRPSIIRLPTQNEWLLAAKPKQKIASKKKEIKVYPFGTLDKQQIEDEANFEHYLNSSESDIKRTTPVWMYPQGASAAGVMDMGGNTWEWLSSLGNLRELQVHQEPNRKSLIFTRNYPKYSGPLLFLLGGAWDQKAEEAHIEREYFEQADQRDQSFGFRILLRYD